MKRLPIADCRLPIDESFASRGFAGGGHDGGEFIGFLQKRGQFSRRHHSRFDQQFEPEGGFVGFLFDGSNFGNEFGLAARAATGAIICRNRGAATDPLFGDNASGIVVFGHGPRQFDDAQGESFGARFQFDWIHGGKLQIQSAISK